MLTMNNASKIKTTSYRHTKKTAKLIEILAEKLQISKANIISVAIALLAERENVNMKGSKTDD